MSDASRPFPVAHPLDRAFFLAFAGVAIVAVAGGFLPKLETIFSGERPWPPFIVHVHAALFYGWIGFFLVQVLLIRRRSIALHRQLGWVGVGLAVLMIAVGSFMALEMAALHLARGADRSLNFLPVPLTDLIAFGVLIAAGIWFRRDAAAHKRLMLLATTALLGAGFARMRLFDLPETPAFPQLEHMVELYGMLWLVMAAAILFDLFTRGRIHRVYLIAVPFMLAMQFLAASLLTWPGWGDFARQAFQIG